MTRRVSPLLEILKAWRDLRIMQDGSSLTVDQFSASLHNQEKVIEARFAKELLDSEQDSLWSLKHGAG